MVFVAMEKSTTPPPSDASDAVLKSTSADTDGQAETAQTVIMNTSSTDTAQADDADTSTAGNVIAPPAETNIKTGTAMDSLNIARPIVSNAAVASPSAAVAQDSQKDTTPYSSPKNSPQMLSPNAAQRLFTICTPEGFELHQEYTEGPGMIEVNTFQMAADAAGYARSGQAGILISAGYGRATTPQSQKLYRNPFCSDTTKFKDEKYAAINVIIPMIKFGQSFGDISVCLEKSKMILLDDPTLDSGSALTHVDAPGTVTKNDKEDDADVNALTMNDNEDGNEIEFTNGMQPILKVPAREIATRPLTKPMKPVNVVDKEYEWEHVEFILKKYAKNNWPVLQKIGFAKFGKYIDKEFAGQAQEFSTACSNFMIDCDVAQDYSTLQANYKKYLSDLNEYQEKMSTFESTTVRFEPSDTTHSYDTKRHYSKAVEDRYLEVIEDGNAKDNKKGSKTRLKMASINDLQRFGFLDKDGEGDSKYTLVNKACTLLTTYPYTEKTKETDPYHRRGLNVVQPQFVNDNPTKTNWVIKSKHAEGSLDQFVGYRSLYPFGSDPPEIVFTGNRNFKMNYQPTGQVDCPKYLMNPPPVNGGPPIDYLLDTCMMTEINLSRDGCTCEEPCGKSLTDGDLVIIWGEDAQRVRGDTIFNGVWTLNHQTLETICRVGVVKFLPHQCEYFQNRIGCVSSIFRCKEDEDATNQDSDSEPDTVEYLHTLPGNKRKTRGIKNVKTEASTSKKPKGGKGAAIDNRFVNASNGYATIVFTDGTVKVKTRGTLVWG